MPPKREKPPKESRAEALVRLIPLLDQMSGKNYITGMSYLLGYFTTADLVGIADALHKELQADVVASSTNG